MNIIISKGKKGCFIDAFQLRNDIFVKEQGFSTEEDIKDDNCTHLVLYENHKAIATGRFYKDHNKYHIGRICVEKAYRHKHIGKYIMELLENEIKKENGHHLILDAQIQAKGFYKTLGYEECGEIFMDEFCPHIPMKKDI